MSAAVLPWSVKFFFVTLPTLRRLLVPSLGIGNTSQSVSLPTLAVTLWRSRCVDGLNYPYHRQGSGGPGRARSSNIRINSPPFYQLDYWAIMRNFAYAGISASSPLYSYIYNIVKLYINQLWCAWRDSNSRPTD